MANQRITELDSATSIDSNDLLYVVEDGVSKKLNVANLVEVGFTTKTIDTAGEISVSGQAQIRKAKVETNGGDATDNLVKITGGYLGEMLIIVPYDSTHTVVVKSNDYLKLPMDFTMDNGNDVLVLVCLGSNTWAEISRSSNGT